jgi:hypothetical protein
MTSLTLLELFLGFLCATTALTFLRNATARGDAS